MEIQLNIKTNTFYAFTQSINCDDECYSYNHFIHPNVEKGNIKGDV